MSDAPAPAPTPAPDPTPAPAPAGAAPAVTNDAPAAPARPEWLPEQFWDTKANALNTDEFGKHYGETAANAQKFSERLAGVPAKPEDYKIELKLPDGVTLPEGATFDPSKDPRLPLFLQTAKQIGLTNAEVNQIVALDAQIALANVAAEGQRVAAETKKLGENAPARIAAVTNWAKGLKEKGDFTDDEFAEIRMAATTAAGVTALEKIMAKASGTVPGHVPTPPSTPEPKHIADRIWPTGFASTPQARTG